MNRSRLDDAPAILRWILISIKEVGFPVVICAWLMYNKFVSDKETVKALQEFKEVMVKVQVTLEQQNRILRHKSSRDD